MPKSIHGHVDDACVVNEAKQSCGKADVHVRKVSVYILEANQSGSEGAHATALISIWREFGVDLVN